MRRAPASERREKGQTHVPVSQKRCELTFWKRETLARVVVRYREELRPFAMPQPCFHAVQQAAFVVVRVMASLSRLGLISPEFAEELDRVQERLLSGGRRGYGRDRLAVTRGLVR
jgi:hypothetical protein